MWKIPLTGRGLEIKHLAMWMCLTLNKKPWFVKMPQLSDRVELQLKEALELIPSGFPHFNFSRTKLVLAGT